MKEFELIKGFYKPIQLAFKAENKEVAYIEIHPYKVLQNFVYCFWQLKTLRPSNLQFTKY